MEIVLFSPRHCPGDGQELDALGLCSARFSENEMLGFQLATVRERSVACTRIFKSNAN